MLTYACFVPPPGPFVSPNLGTYFRWYGSLNVGIQLYQSTPNASGVYLPQLGARQFVYDINQTLTCGGSSFYVVETNTNGVVTSFTPFSSIPNITC